MAFVTLDQARAAGRTRRSSAFAATELREAAAAPLGTQYDFFLSHTREDALAIAGVKDMIETEGFSVYVYWAEGDITGRVDRATAEILRVRMDNCRSLIYASSDASPDSRWMPWELGYFDGSKPERVAIMPLINSPGSRFAGQEYLTLYPNLEHFNWENGSQSLGVRTGERSGRRLGGFIAYGASV